MLHVKTIVNSLHADGDVVLEHDQIDSILNGLLEEFNQFVMQMYDTHVPQSMMLKHSSMSRRHNMISSVKSWSIHLFLQML